MRKRRVQRAQFRHTKKLDGKCEFCDFSLSTPHVLKEQAYFWLVKNIFPYEMWDTAGVSEHLMLIPKRHVDSIAHFNKAELSEYIKLIADYEAKGFSIYARASTNKMKSIAHQHTHLIKLNNKARRFIFWMRKPHILLTK